MGKINFSHQFCKVVEALANSDSKVSSALKVSVILLILVGFFVPAPQAKAEVPERVPIFLSDVSQVDPPLSLAKILIDAKRRSFRMEVPIYQCDSSLAATGQMSSQGVSPYAKIAVQGKTYAKGIGIGTPFVLTYELGGAYSSFVTVAGTEDLEPAPQDWTFEVYCDDVKAGSWKVTKDKPAEIKLDMTGVQELVLVGAGRDRMMVDLAGAYLVPSTSVVRADKISATNRKAILDLDDQLVSECEAFLMGRSAKKVDSELGPDDSAVSLGGFGRTTSTRGADMWAAIRDKGDLIRWQAFTRRAGEYRVWVRVVSSAPGQKPNPEDYIVRIDGKVSDCQLARQMIVERMADERFTSHLWGYIYADLELEPGVHDVEIENASGDFLAVNRAVLVQQSPIANSLPVKSPLKPITAAQDFAVSERWEPRTLFGQKFVSSDNSSAPFDRNRPVDVMFLPDLVNYNAVRDFHTTRLLGTKKPFSIHVRFCITDTRFHDPIIKPVVDKETYDRIKSVAGDLWQGFWTSEWSDNYNFSPEASAMPKPKTRKEAYERVKSWYQVKASMVYDDILSMCVSWQWDHYAGEWSGVSGFMDETGISPRNQLRMLFPRGAARQFGKYWHSYAAPGAHDSHSWIMNNYMTHSGSGSNSRHGPHSGCSISWIKRTMYLTYMWGTTSFHDESPAYETDITPDGKLALSPMGEVATDFYEFTSTHKNRGVSYTPVGLMLDFMHGWGSRGIYPDAYPVLTWGCLQPEPSDYMKDALFDILYPGQCDELNERNILSNTPYGDLFDVMISSATPEHIEAYPVLFLVGDVAVDMNDTLASNLEAYVRNGGTLVINVEQVSAAFPKELLGVEITEKTRQANSSKCKLDDCEIKGQPFSYRVVKTKKAKPVISTLDNNPLVTRNAVGKGAVILTTVPYLLHENFNAVSFLPHLMEHLTSGLVPFQVTGDVEYAVNRNEDSWLVTIINNRGVYKLPTEPAVYDKSQTQTVYITLDKKPSQLSDWISGKPLSAEKVDKKLQVTVAVPPGDVMIVQIKD